MPTTAILAYLKLVTSPNTLAQIAYECALPGQARGCRSSPTLYMSIRDAFPELAPQLAKVRTSWRALKLLLGERLTKEHLGPKEVTVRRMMNLLILVKKLVCVLFCDKPITERQALSDIRHHVIKKNFDLAMVNAIKKDGRFAMDPVRKELCKAQQLRAVTDKTIHQRSIDYELATQVGVDLVQACRSPLSLRSIPLLLTTVMYATGARVTEVVLLSTFRPDGDDTIVIDPVAKGRTGGDAKTSSRQLLFGLTSAECASFTGSLRTLLGIRYGDRYRSLDRSVRQDREDAMRLVIAPLTRFVDKTFGHLLIHRPRDLRALYVALSYREFAKHPTSECMWINRVLGHGSMDTSIAYNSFHLLGGGGHYNKTRFDEQAAEIASLKTQVTHLRTRLRDYYEDYCEKEEGVISSSKEESGPDPWPLEGSSIDGRACIKRDAGQEEGQTDRIPAPGSGADDGSGKGPSLGKVQKRPREPEDEAYASEAADDEASTATITTTTTAAAVSPVHKKKKRRRWCRW